MPLLKLITTYFGKRPAWFTQYEEQMRRFRHVAWEHYPRTPPPTNPEKREQWKQEGLADFNRRVAQTAGVPCNKNEWAVCDLRPAYGEAFAESFAGYDYWGWADVDVMFGDLDGLLPGLLEGYDVLQFKPYYLSGPLAIFRNTPEMTSLYRRGRYQEVFPDTRYHIWDDAGYIFLGGYDEEYGRGECFYNYLIASGVKMRTEVDLYSYDTPREWNFIECRSGKLFDPLTDNEKLFHHFMTDVWPVRSNGRSRFRGKGKAGALWPKRFRDGRES